MEAVSLKTQVEELNQMVLEGRIMDAFEHFYTDDVVMQENDQPPTVGKAANRIREEAFISNLVDFRGAEVKSLAVNEEEGVTMVEWFFDYTHKEWGDRTFSQVSVQQWRDGRIAREQFFYGN